jgi:uncharacterized membrane protein
MSDLPISKSLMKEHSLIESLTGYVETNIQLVKLEIRDSVSRVLLKLINIFILCILGFFVWIFLALAAAYYLNFLNAWPTHQGFGVVGLAHIFFLFLFWLFRRPIMWIIEVYIEKKLPLKIRIKALEKKEE